MLFGLLAEDTIHAGSNPAIDANEMLIGSAGVLESSLLDFHFAFSGFMTFCRKPTPAQVIVKLKT